MKLKARDMQFMIGGLVMGLLVGMAASAAGLFGTVVEPGNENDTAIEVDPSRFYTVEFNSAADWLNEVDPEASEALASDIQVLNNWDGTIGLEQFQPENLETLILAMHQALLDEENVSGNQKIQTCIGIDQNPYSLTGPGIYLYWELPEDKGSDLPSNWTSATQPREESIYWSAQCISGNDSKDNN